MIRRRSWFPRVVLAGVALALSPAAAPAEAAAATPLLRVLPSNPRYFTGDGVHALYLTGSHTWHTLQDYSTKSYPPEPFDFPAFLAMLKANGHNFFRLWTWEQQRWDCFSASDERWYAPPAYARVTGHGDALDGLPKYDVTTFNADYFQRMHDRVELAQRDGIYVAVMLFQGVSLEFKRERYRLPWKSHPYHAANNVNGVDADTNHDGQGYDFHQWPLAPRVWELQQAYIRKVVDTVNAFDNVLYEVSNEAHPQSELWQYHVIRFIRDYEAAKPKQHPVGMTAEFPDGGTLDLYAGPADWISPSGIDWDWKNPPLATGRKVVLADTDHLPGAVGDRRWVWKTFMRGNQPIYMDEPKRQDDVRVGARRAMGQTRAFAQRVDLEKMIPSDRADECSSTYLLREPGAAYIAYQPEGASLKLRLPAGTYACEFFNPADESTSARTLTQPAAGDASFERPAHASDDWVVFVRKQSGVAGQR